ncbi:hypothetical protein AMTR_s00021p00129030 [Amborella trichopoda]|uniref:Uncharacterized protein n=1 Tax=Amborella trichopoda TaxID=13333 RepID=W1PV82_AMBTC|nr:hypothetical protein AMTR_s00021p00129030 [Amborella trichopoda]
MPKRELRTGEQKEGPRPPEPAEGEKVTAMPMHSSSYEREAKEFDKQHEGGILEAVGETVLGIAQTAKELITGGGPEQKK